MLTCTCCTVHGGDSVAPDSFKPLHLSPSQHSATHLPRVTPSILIIDLLQPTFSNALQRDWKRTETYSKL